MSKSRSLVLATLERTGGFASAQEIHQLTVRNGDRIGLTTIYRALQSLLSASVVDSIRKDDGEVIYRLCGETHHHHLVCKKCGVTVEVEGGTVEKWVTATVAKNGFHDVHHSAELFGVCSSCYSR